MYGYYKQTAKNSGGKFLKQLCCWVDKEYNKITHLVLSSGLIIWIGHRKDIRKMTFRRLESEEKSEEV